MKQFPDISRMEKSKDGTEPIRGGSIGLNRILGFFEDASKYDRSSRFQAVAMNAYTVFRNIWGSTENKSPEELDRLFTLDIKLFSEYYDTYLSHVLSNIERDKKAIVVVYFPDYGKVPKDVLIENVGRKEEFEKAYLKFHKRHALEHGVFLDLNNVVTVIEQVGHAMYPHKEVIAKIREVSRFPKSLYTSRDTLCLVSHIPLDFYIMYQNRNVMTLESYTGKLRPSSDFKLKLDSDGRVLFCPTTHITFGDGVMIKGLAKRKAKADLLKMAEDEKWNLSSEVNIQRSIVKYLGLPQDYFRKYNLL